MAEHTALHATDKDGKQFSVSHTETDSPILPAANLRELKAIDPSIVSFVIEQTKAEAEFRRAETKKINLFVFLERISGVVAGLTIAITVFVLGYLLVLAGHDWAGVALCGTALVSIVGLFITKKVTDKGSQNQTSPSKSTRNRRRR